MSSIPPGRILEAKTSRQLQREGLSASDTLSIIRDNDKLYQFPGNTEAYDSRCYALDPDKESAGWLSMFQWLNSTLCSADTLLRIFLLTC